MHDHRPRHLLHLLTAVHLLDERQRKLKRSPRSSGGGQHTINDDPLRYHAEKMIKNTIKIIHSI